MEGGGKQHHNPRPPPPAASSPNHHHSIPPGVSKHTKHTLPLLPPATQAAIDHLATLSAQAQGLRRGAISTVARVLNSREDHSLYILALTPNHPIGLIKVGRKHLWVSTDGLLAEGGGGDGGGCGGGMRETDALCLLDFYVHESRQRQGLGAFFFRAVLREEEEEEEGVACRLAYDRPSARLLPFLEKHFGLVGGRRQHNHFMLFPGFFSEKRKGGREEKEGGKEERRGVSSSSSSLVPSRRRLPQQQEEEKAEERGRRREGGGGWKALARRSFD